MYGPAAETWYFEYKLPQYAALFDKYWEENWYNDHVEPNGGEAS